ncbi:MAG: major facilitator superfamily domain-containing protein 1 [Bacteroidetes bacterium]|nr:major facilitator superfamily domain-containing protein 1 [Bacteroidota bacterium]
MTEKVQRILSESKAARWTALALISLTMLSAYYFVDMIAPLQSLLELKPYNWTPSNYGFFSGSEYMLNVLGFLIISGIILDKMGIRFTGLTATAVMLAGGLIKMYGLTEYFSSGGFLYDFFNSFWTSMPATAKVAALGYAVFGIGVEMAGITTSRTVVKWFKGKELALAMGMQLATARLGASIAFFFSAPLAGVKVVDGVLQGNVLNPIYLGVALLAIGFLTFLTYTFMDTRLDKQTGNTSTGADPTEEFHLSDLGKIITNRGFLLISFLCVLFYSGVFPFLKYAVNMMQNKLGVSPDTGGMIAGLLPVGTILLTPIIGYFLDTKGKGATMMIFGSALLMVAHLTFALVPINMALAIVSIIVLGIAFSLIPASMWPSVPKIVEERYLGSAYALVFFIQNIGLMFFPWLIGVVLEAVNPGVADRMAAGDPTAIYNYTVPMLVFAGLGASAILLAFLLRREDRIKGYGLESPNKKK